jgi:hypothetical protein
VIMLTRTILLPSIFGVNPEKSYAKYGMVIRFLQDLEKNGIVLVDDTHCIRDAMIEDIKKWPQKYRTKAQQLLIVLEEKDRFVKMSLNDEVQAKCKNQQCQLCIRMAKIYLPPALISSNHCKECAEREMTQFPSIEVVDVDEYSMSNFFDAHLKLNGDFSAAKGELNQQEFEDKVLIPLLIDAKDVKIYDRYIGRSILNKKIAKKYKFTIKWILDIFLRERGSKLNGVFYVYGGIHSPQIHQDQIQNAINKLRELETEFKQVYPKFQLIIKDETKGEEMPHDRFLVTNQVAVSVGRGFNLLFGSPSRLQDVKIDYCSDPGKIEKEVRNLPDL